MAVKFFELRLRFAQNDGVAVRFFDKLRMTEWLECACIPLRMTGWGDITSLNDNALVTIRVGRGKKR